MVVPKPIRCCWSVLCLGVVLAGSTLFAAEYDEAWTAFQAGKYETALQATEAATQESFAEVRWWRLRLECLATLGRYREGAEVLKVALRRQYSNGPLRVVGFDILRQDGQLKEARDSLAELLRIASYSPWMLRNPEDRVWLGRGAVKMGVDARQILEQFYDEAKKLNPDLRDVYLATGELALLKQDHAVAAEAYRSGLKKHPEDPDLLVGLAYALAEDQPQASQAALEQALAKNPQHLAGLQKLAEDALHYEDYRAARAALDRIHAVNPAHPPAWALRAVLAHLQADAEEERRCREFALCYWDANPEIDHLIGSKLSAAYRFREGAAYQQRALEMDPQYLPARTQLAQDLLRLGDSAAGWKLVQEVQQADAYNVVAFNLATLHDHLTHYTTLETPHFSLHMEQREAAVYGQRVLALLERARKTLGEKYGWQQPGRVTVEVLTNQKDFAIRSFGLPGGDGILGVCFGMVITANSPAALAGKNTNWEATLWHEYCHVVTLEMTGHRLPRWLSEGISVFEERQANPTWGNRLNRPIRQMILAGEMAPIAELNQSFRRPKSAEHFNLAYYQASLVVEYIVSQFGQDKLLFVLRDVAAGVPINQALERRLGSLSALETGFAEFARHTATQYGAQVDWSDADLPPLPAQATREQITTWLQDRPSHYLGRLRLAQACMWEKQWPDAREVLTKLIADAPQWAGDDSPYALLAAVHRAEANTASERQVLEASASRSDDALETVQRLMELAAAEKDLPALEKNCERYLAIQPLHEFPYRLLAEQCEQQQAALPSGIAAARALLALDPPDRAGAHFLLAKLLRATKDPAAKRHVLLALEETPRFRAAQQMLLELLEPQEKP
jgi:predicted Zn-dependent protease